MPCGTTGEGATLSADEQRRVIEIAVEVAQGRVPVIAGCGSNNVAARDRADLHAAKDVGADAALVVMPYYNRPSQAGMLAALHGARRASALPIIVYNVPSRTVADISVETLAEIGEAAQHRRGQGRDRQSCAGSPPSGSRAARISSSSAAMTTWRWASTRWAGSAAFRSPPMSRRGCAPNSRRRCARAAGTRRWSCRTGSIRSTPRCSPTLRRGRPNMRCRGSGPAFRPSFACRWPSRRDASKRAVDAALEHAGLI